MCFSRVRERGHYVERALFWFCVPFGNFSIMMRVAVDAKVTVPALLRDIIVTRWALPPVTSLFRCWRQKQRETFPWYCSIYDDKFKLFFSWVVLLEVLGQPRPKVKIIKPIWSRETGRRWCISIDLCYNALKVTCASKLLTVTKKVVKYVSSPIQLHRAQKTYIKSFRKTYFSDSLKL